MQFQRYFIAMFLLSISILSSAQAILEDDLDDCIDLKKFKYMDYTPMPDTPSTRKLGSKDDSPTVSVQESYRIRYTYRDIKFLDLKIEYPVKGNYEKDKATLAEFFEHLGDVGAKDNKLVHFDDLFGMECYVLDRYKPLERFYTLSSNILFDDENERFIYLYYWNVNREKILFSDMNEFLDLKAVSFEQIINCIFENE